MAKALVVVGILIAGLGVAMMVGFPLGRLPGDIVYRRENMTIHVPIGTSIFLSVALTVVMMLIRR